MVKNKKLKFEEAVTRLEEIVQQLEGETVPHQTVPRRAHCRRIDYQNAEQKQ